MSFRTADGTDKSGEVHVGKIGTLTFAPGETTKTITIEVKSDNKKEANETFYLDLFGNNSNSLFPKYLWSRQSKRTSEPEEDMECVPRSRVLRASVPSTSARRPISAALAGPPRRRT